MGSVAAFQTWRAAKVKECSFLREPGDLWVVEEGGCGGGPKVMSREMREGIKEICPVGTKHAHGSSGGVECWGPLNVDRRA